VDLADRVATAYRDYISARRRAERYRDVVVPKARELAILALQAQAAGQFEALKVLEAQRSIETSKLEYIKSLGDAWKAAATLAGLTLEEPWPPSPNPMPQPQAGGNGK
jgi:cobalt-zinc-cadmium efflux system outer membrane protein